MQEVECDTVHDINVEPMSVDRPDGIGGRSIFSW